MKFLALSLLLVAPALQAQMGADVLLQATGNQDESISTAGSLEFPGNITFKLTDTFLHTLFVEYRQKPTSSPEINRWFNHVFTGEFASAAHQWNMIQEKMPESLLPMAKETWVYLTWRMQLPQTFIDAYQIVRMTPVASENLRMALDQVLSKELTAAWLIQNSPMISAAYSEKLLSMTAPIGVDLELNAWVSKRDPANAFRVLNMLPIGHPLTMKLANTAVLDFARKGQIGEAGKLLKRRVEPSLEKIHDVKSLPSYYLTLGRLLYQAGAFEASEAFYAKVPRGTHEFIPARAERTWTLLRLGRIGELRGELESLSHNLLSDRFLPEVALVRSISNLKLCRYDDVAQDMNAFIAAHRVWGQKIKTALAEPAKAEIDDTDDRIYDVRSAINAHELEAEKLTILTKESIRAALPAVGEQAHWIAANRDLSTVTNELKRQMVSQKQRYWRNRELVLNEAIRKLKFVRIEAMSQVRMANEEADKGAVEVTDTAKKIESAQSRGSQTYPVDGVYWPDELFKMHSLAKTRCGGKTI